MEKYTLVQFEDGKYGIRIGGFFDVLFGLGKCKFVDLVNNGHSWYPSSEYFGDCKGSYERVKIVYDKKTFKHKAVCRPVVMEKKMISFEEYQKAKAFYEREITEKETGNNTFN